MDDNGGYQASYPAVLSCHWIRMVEWYGGPGNPDLLEAKSCQRSNEKKVPLGCSLGCIYIGDEISYPVMWGLHIYIYIS